MKTKLALLLVVFVVAFATPAMAARNIKALNIFPWTPVEVDVPLYPGDLESMCLTDIEGTICEVNQEGGTLVTKDIPYSGTLTVPYSGNALFSGELPVTASGTVPFDTYNVIPGGGELTYAVIGAGLCGNVDEASKQNCCEVKGNPDGSVHLVCYKVPAENVINNQTFTYDICQAQTVDVPWSYTGTAPFSGSVPYKGTVEAPYNGSVQAEYKEYGPSDVIFAEGNVILDCPAQDEVPTQAVSFKELVTNATVGDTIELEASGYTALEKTVTYRVVVKYAKPGSGIFKTVFKTEKEVETVNGIFKEQVAGGYKFEKAGTYQFMFKVWRPNGMLAGKAVTRTVVVTE